MTQTAPEPPRPVATTREKGYAYDGAGLSFWADLTYEPTPELQWPDSVAVFDRMRKQDAQVSSVLRAVTAPILRTGWSIDGNGCRDEVTEFVARCLGLPIKGADPEEDFTAGLRGRDRFSWHVHAREALLMLPFGHSFFEQVYRADPDGRYRLRKLALRPHRTISRVNVARDGGLVSIEQHGTLSRSRSGSAEVTLPVNRLVAYAHEREGGNWLGVSVLRPAYKNWLLKDRALRAWSTSVDRNGMGVPIYEGAENEKDLSAGRKLATQVRGGSNAGGAVPHGAKLDLKGVSGSTVDIDKFVRYQDEQIARAVLAHFLNLGTQTGSWALGSTFADFFTLSLQMVAEDFRDTANAHVVEDLVDVNWGSAEPAPRLHFDEIGQSQTEAALAEMYGTGEDDAEQEQLGEQQRAKERAQYLRKSERGAHA